MSDRGYTPDGPPVEFSAPRGSGSVQRCDAAPQSSTIQERLRDLFLPVDDPDAREEDGLALEAADEIDRLEREVDLANAELAEKDEWMRLKDEAITRLTNNVLNKRERIEELEAAYGGLAEYDRLNALVKQQDKRIEELEKSLRAEWSKCREWKLECPGHHFNDDQINAAWELAEAKWQASKWIKAISPGGWIDNLRRELVEANAAKKILGDSNYELCEKILFKDKRIEELERDLAVARKEIHSILGDESIIITFEQINVAWERRNSFNDHLMAEGYELALLELGIVACEKCGGTKTRRGGVDGCECYECDCTNNWW